MSDCCSTTDNTCNRLRKYRCPVNGKEYSGVSSTTILHHIKEPWNWEIKEQSYYFCDDPDCNVVYFGQDDSTIEREALRTTVGLKQKTDTALICYCFGVHANEVKADSSIKEFVIKQTKQHACACETRNPSGKCCLKDFPK